MSIILASKSPRRKELLSYITKNFEIIDSKTDEKFDSQTKIEKIPETLAFNKVFAIRANHLDDTIIAADTIVVIDDKILNKPKTKQEAVEMLKMLSNRTHKVITGVCVTHKNKTHLFHCVTKVTFYPLSDKQIDDYIATGSPFDKAGGYGIQDQGALFVKKINGDYYNVMGLPIAKLNHILSKYTK